MLSPSKWPCRQLAYVHLSSAQVTLFALTTELTHDTPHAPQFAVVRRLVSQPVFSVDGAQCS